MKKASKSSALPSSSQHIERHIYLLRGKKTMLDRDLAKLYGVRPIALRQQVMRNKERFPADFMFQLTPDEAEALVSQSVIPSRRSLGGNLPYMFTQEGVAMLSSVLRNRRAIQMNIMIMRAFVRLREMIETDKELATRIAKLETGHVRTASIIDVLVDEIENIARNVHTLKTQPVPAKRKIGFDL